eukprot:1926070-Rhodomonas_salina.1
MMCKLLHLTARQVLRSRGRGSWPALSLLQPCRGRIDDHRFIPVVAILWHATRTFVRASRF